MGIKDIFDEIANESSTNKKMELLAKYISNEVLKQVLYLTYSPRVKFYIKQIPEYNPDNSKPEKLTWGLEGLKPLSSREFTGHKASKWLTVVLSGISPDDAYIIERIIAKDAKIGMATSNINKVFEGLIEETPYMGAKAFSEKLANKIVLEGNAISQVKMDGRYANVIVVDNEVTLESRSGETTLLTGAKLLKEFNKLPDCVLNGELTMKNKTRYESNGIIASLVSICKKEEEGKDITKEIEKFLKEHNMKFEEALNAVMFTTWDMISLVEYSKGFSSTKYKDRLNNVQSLLTKHKLTLISLIESKKILTYDEAINHFTEMLHRGEEGTILKSLEAPWKDGKHNFQIKMKLEIDVDLIITDFDYGTGKNLYVISTLNAKSSDGKVITRPAGMSEKTMEYITNNQKQLLGTIVEVKCCGLSKNADGNYSLLHPRFKQLRDDKKTADSLESIQKIEAMAKKLK